MVMCRQSTVVRCLEDDGVLQEPHSLGDSEELSSGDDASGRSAGEIRGIGVGRCRVAWCHVLG